ncbi:hypothetical protein [Amycolatopsis speibonae]|uniref:Uncharacterized protein n=1 Tax=Amycolatopsis speibonae TaxID=1450224 RepID=A0ABV7NSB1_9PSEU
MWNANFGFTAAMLGGAAAAKVWTGEPEPVLANAGQPGTAVAVDGERPATTEAGKPDVRLFHVRQDQLKIEHTWDVIGMFSTGSHRVVIEDAFVPAELTANIDDPLRLDRPTYRLNPILPVFAGCTAVALGTVEEAIDELVALAPGKASPFGGPLAEQPHVRETLARPDRPPPPCTPICTRPWPTRRPSAGTLWSRRTGWAAPPRSTPGQRSRTAVPRRDGRAAARQPGAGILRRSGTRPAGPGSRFAAVLRRPAYVTSPGTRSGCGVTSRLTSGGAVSS